MPFNHYEESPQLPPSRVEVRFKGLILIRPDGATCTVRLHSSTPDHFLIVEVMAKRPGGGLDLVTRRAGALQNHLTIRVDPAPAEPRVSGYHPEGAGFTRKFSADTRDLRWAIDLLHPDFHGRDGLTANEGAEKVIRVLDGIFFTADITDDGEMGVRRTRQGDNLDLFKIATVIGLRIPLPAANSNVVLDWGGGDEIRLPRPVGAGQGQDPENTTYKISVRNDPVGIDFEPTHDELEEYYDLVRKPGNVAVPPFEQFSLEITPRGIHKRGTDRIPCMPVIVGE